MALKSGKPSKGTLNHINQIKRQLADDQSEMRLNVRMTKTEYRNLKRFALDEEMSVLEVVRVALSEYMSR